jgi:hypothetical protein
MMIHTYNSSTQKDKAGEFECQASLGSKKLINA